MWYITQRVYCGKGKMKIFLCGFSGAGKTTLLSELKGKNFLKVFDALNENRQNYQWQLQNVGLTSLDIFDQL